MKNIVMLIFMILFIQTSTAQNIFESVPNKVETNKQYVIYLHGAIIERGDPKPLHPRFGLYDFPAIQKALASKDIVLISEQRKPQTIPAEYAKKVESQVNTLIEKGIKPENITVLGFSKGAGITIIASNNIKNPKLNYIIMATCGDWYDKSERLKKLRLTGHVLSVYELSDGPGSCKSLAEKSSDLQSFKEVVTNTGKAHGTFFLPRDVWMQPVFEWIFRTKS